MEEEFDGIGCKREKLEEFEMELKGKSVEAAVLMAAREERAVFYVHWGFPKQQ